MQTGEGAPPVRLTGWRGLVLGSRFLSELVLFSALGYAGAALPEQLGLKIAFAVAAPAAAITAWGLCLAPRAKRLLPEPWRMAVEVMLFAAAAAAVSAAGHPLTGILLVGVTGISVAALTRIAVADR